MKGVIITPDGPIEVGNTREEQLLIEQLVDARQQVERMSKIMDQCDVIMGKNNRRVEKLRSDLWWLVATCVTGGFSIGLLFARMWWDI